MPKIYNKQTKKNSIKKKVNKRKTKKMTSLNKKNDISKQQTINVQNPWFNYIKQGRKKIEGRLNKGKFADLKVNDIVIWENAGQKIRTKLTRIGHYKTFNDMLTNEGLRNVLPDITTLDAGVAVYRQFYSEEKEAMYGVLAIEVQLL